MLKHWQLFLLIVLPLAWVSPSPLQEMINSIGIITFGLWIYGIGIYGHSNLKEEQAEQMNLSLFKLNSKMSILTLLLIYIITQIHPDFDSSFSIYNLIMIPISLYLIYTIFYIVIFSSKTLTSLELDRQVTFSDYFFKSISYW